MSQFLYIPTGGALLTIHTSASWVYLPSLFRNNNYGTIPEIKYIAAQ